MSLSNSTSYFASLTSVVDVRGELTAGATVGNSRDVWGREANVDVCVEVERFLEFFMNRFSDFFREESKSPRSVLGG